MRTFRGAVFALAVTVVLFGCNQAPGAIAPPAQDRTHPAPLSPSDEPPFVPDPTPTPSGPPPVPSDWPTKLGTAGTYTQDFSGKNVSMADWKDPKADDGYTQPWLSSGTWAVTSAYPAVAPGSDASGSRGFASAPTTSGMALDYNSNQPQPLLSFRRYAGKAFGTDNGELPAHYQASVTLVPISARADFFPPIGDQGTPVYYLDPQHYVEVLIKPDKFEVWECNGGVPLGWKGWHPLYQEDASHSAGVAYTLGAEVDSNAGTMRVYQDGVFKREIKSGIIKPYSHYFAIRGGSNHVQFTNISIQGY